MSVIPEIEKVREVSEKAARENEVGRVDRERRAREGLSEAILGKANSILRSAAQRIGEASEKGQRKAYVTLDREMEGNQKVMEIVREDLIRGGFDVAVRAETTNHGDSAAPCVRDEWLMEISW